MDNIIFDLFQSQNRTLTDQSQYLKAPNENKLNGQRDDCYSSYTLFILKHKRSNTQPHPSINLGIKPLPLNNYFFDVC